MQVFRRYRNFCSYISHQFILQKSKISFWYTIEIHCGTPVKGKRFHLETSRFLVDSIRDYLCLFKCHVILVLGRSAFHRAARFILTQRKQHTKRCKICGEAQENIFLCFADTLFGGRCCVYGQKMSWWVWNLIQTSLLAQPSKLKTVATLDKSSSSCSPVA